MTTDNTPIVAAFDLDGTLSDGGSVFKWLRYLRGRRATYAAGARLALPLLVGAIRSGRWADRAKERLFGRLLRGLELNDVREASRDVRTGALRRARSQRGDRAPASGTCARATTSSSSRPHPRSTSTWWPRCSTPTVASERGWPSTPRGTPHRQLPGQELPRPRRSCGGSTSGSAPATRIRAPHAVRLRQLAGRPAAPSRGGPIPSTSGASVPSERCDSSRALSNDEVGLAYC